MLQRRKRGTARCDRSQQRNDLYAGSARGRHSPAKVMRVISPSGGVSARVDLRNTLILTAFIADHRKACDAYRDMEEGVMM